MAGWFRDVLERLWKQQAGDVEPVNVWNLQAVTAARLAKTRLPAVAIGPTWAETAPGWVVDEGLRPLALVPEADVGDGDASRRGLVVAARASRWNGSGWDRERNTVDAILQAALALPDGFAGVSLNFTAHNARALLVVVTTTASAGTPSISFLLRWRGPAGGTPLTLWTSAGSVTGNGTIYFLFMPGATGGTPPNEHLNLPLPRELQFVIVEDAGHGPGDSITALVETSLVSL